MCEAPATSTMCGVRRNERYFARERITGVRRHLRLGTGRIGRVFTEVALNGR